MRILYCLLAFLLATPVFGGVTRVAPLGVEPNGPSYEATISANGRFVAFTSEASNLVPNDTNGLPDVFVFDRISGEIELVSVGMTGDSSNGASSYPSISGDGGDVAFQSNATDLVTGQLNGRMKIYVRERDEGEVLIASVAYDGGEVNGDCITPSISSSNSDYLAFATLATNLKPPGWGVGLWTQIYVTNVYTPYSAWLVSAETEFGNEGNAASRFPSCQDNGLNFITFESDAYNLVYDDWNASTDVFVYDFLLPQLTRVTGLEEGNGPSRAVQISVGGRYVAFATDASNYPGGRGVFVIDRHTGTMTRVGGGGQGVTACSLSSDGRFLTYQETDGKIYLVDRLGGSVVIDGCVPSNGSSRLGRTWAVSSDGRFVAFASEASNLVANDMNSFSDVFVFDRAITPTSGSVNAGGGSVTNVLTLNGAPGSALVPVGMPMTASLTASPAGPPNTDYLLWVWVGSAIQPSLQDFGCVARLPTTAALCVRSDPLSHLCSGGRAVRGPALAPWTIRRVGFARPRQMVLQGIICDNGTLNPTGFSVTNAVSLEIR